MSNEKIRGAVVGESAEQAEERHPNDADTFNKALISLLESDLEMQGIRQKHAKELNPKLLSMAWDIRLIRWVVVPVAVVTPILLLWFLLSQIYSGLPMLINSKMEALMAVDKALQKAEMVSALSAPLTALIIGTFASFVIVYTALLVGIFRSGVFREKESTSDISPAVFDAIRNMTGNNS